MNLRALFGLVLRPSFVATLAAIGALILAGMWMEHTIGATTERMHLRYFQAIYNALAYALLVSLGGFLGRATEELESIRATRTLPGLRSQIHRTLLLLVPIVAGAALLFLVLMVPRQFVAIHYVPQFLLHVFLFCLGLGLGWSWLLQVVVVMMFSKLGFLGEHLRDSPVAFSVFAFGGAAALLALHRLRFLARPVDAPDRASTLRRLLAPSGFLATPFGRSATLRASAVHLKDAPDWAATAHAGTLSGLLQAGKYERMGNRMGLLPRTVFATALVYAAFGLLILPVAKTGQTLPWREFATQVFAADTADPLVVTLRVTFACLVGLVGYVCAVLLDTSLAPGLWHPVARFRRGQAAFFSHLRQNLAFAGVHFAAALAVVAGFGASAGLPFSWSALAHFALPAIIAFVLAPIPQGAFPNGVEVFRRKVSPFRQLLAGILGGLFCLLICYWTLRWPTKLLHEQLSPLTRFVLFAHLGAAVYALYYLRTRHYYARADFARRSG